MLKFYNGLGRVGLKGLAVRLRMARPIQSQLLNVDPLQLFPTPRPGGRPRQHRRRSSSTPACSPRGACVCIIAMPAGVLACASPSEIPGDPLQQPPSGRVHCGGHAEDRRQAASSQGMDPYWVHSARLHAAQGCIQRTAVRSRSLTKTRREHKFLLKLC